MAAPAETARPLVLVVEDDDDTRYVYQVVLEEGGFRVLTSETGLDGLRAARRRAPAAIILDISIPEMDGWTVTERLKEDPKTGAIPIIIVTASAFPEDRVRARRLGCDAFLTKPCPPRAIVQAVRAQVLHP